MLDSILESLHVVALPTKTDFRSITTREVALFQGQFGWGEFSPFLEYSPTESVPWLASGIESAFLPSPETKLLQIRVNATLPAVNGADRVAKVLSWFPGCDTIKIKVGSNLQEDLARISYARALQPDAKIRLDVNCNWSVEEAVRALRAINENFGEIEYVEQPCATLDELRDLKSKIGIPMKIAGDEVARKAADPLTINLAGAIDILILKVAPLGGVARSHKIAAVHGIPSVVSSALESAVGIAHGLRLAGSFDSQIYSAGLATGRLLAADVALLELENGYLNVQSVTPSAESLSEYSVSLARLTWWRERVRHTWDAGASKWIQLEGWM